jgi:para-aminobenzoate synthetase component 1
MSWKRTETLPWQAPLSLAQPHAQADMALLYSGLHEEFTGQFSYLFLEPLEEKSGNAWAELPPLPTESDNLPLWVGYLGYGMREEAARAENSPITLPDFRLVRYRVMFRFDHKKRAVERFESALAGDTKSITTSTIREHATIPTPATPHAQRPLLPLTSNLTRAEYEHIVAATIERIRAGDFYQANITRKFFGEFAETPTSFELFTKLCEASPAPYSAYIRHGESAILSSSPECFLSIDAAGIMTTRPIKGSARRLTDDTEDKKNREALSVSEKNHAENLMIVDLMRNDLARVSEPMSVKVIEQSKLYSYRTIHHLISTIRSKKRADISAYEAVRASFPAGSMTGAPKIAAMRWCTAQEKRERGVYSGAIGWFGAGNICDFSVVIRTLIIHENRFEFQVGGGIVVDSTPEDERKETIAKARGIITALGISEDALERL